VISLFVHCRQEIRENGEKSGDRPGPGCRLVAYRRE